MEKAAGNRGKGRPKGSVNKTTRVFKEAIEAAADAAHPDGVVGYLTQQAQENPVAFMSLIGRVLPTQISGDPDGAPLTVQVVRFTQHSGNGEV